jgi:hypothetical protein
LVAIKPVPVDELGALVGVGTVEQYYAIVPGAICQQAQQVALGAPGLGEDDGPFGGIEILRLCKGGVQRLQ